MKNTTIGLMAAVLIALAGGMAEAKDITLSWGASERATGYKIYCQKADTEPAPPFPFCADAGDVLTYTVPNLEAGRWWFAATAYNTTGESAYSNIVGENAIPGAPAIQIQAVVNISVTVSP